MKRSGTIFTQASRVLWLAVCVLVTAPFAVASPSATGSSDGESDEKTREYYRVYIGEPIIVTASRLREPLERALSSVSVITEQDIARQQAVTVSEVLRAVPGMDVQSSGGTYGSMTDLRLRGAEPDQLLVLLDGMEVNSSWLASFNFADLPVENVEWIEVVRGPASALYGSEAVGGVVNIISKRGSGGPRSALTLEGGSLGTARGLFSMNGSAGSVDYSLSLSRLISDGLGERDGYGNTSFSAGLGVEPAPNQEIRLTTRYVDGRKQVPYDFPMLEVYFDPELGTWIGLQTLDPNNRIENRSFNIALRYAQTVNDTWDYWISLGQMTEDLTNENSGDPDSSYISTVARTGLDSRRSSVETQHNLRFFNWNVLSFGAEAEIEEADREDFSNLSAPWNPNLQYSSVDEDRVNMGYFVQDKLDFGPVLPPMRKDGRKGNPFSRAAEAMRLRGTVVAGARLDDNSQFGSEVTPRFAAGLTAERTRTTLAVSWSESFNAPSLTDLYFPGFSNPSLKPERSTTTEIRLSQELLGPGGVEKLLSDMGEAVEEMARDLRGEESGDVEVEITPRKLSLTLDGSYFSTDYEDLIYSTLEPSGRITLSNIARAEIDGLEAGLTGGYGNSIGARFHYTYLEARRWRGPGEPQEALPRRPHYLYDFSLWAKLFKDLTANLAVNSTSSVPDGFNFVGADGILRFGDREGYTKVDLALSCALRARYRFHVKLENLLDREYEEVKGYPAPGRTVLAGVTVGF
jgi:vitamin B12 transporter